MSRPRSDEPPAAPTGPGPVKLYVGQISPHGSLRDLEDLFARYGRILNVEIKPAGFGFVEYDDPRDAEDAVKHLHDHPFEGRRLIVEFSRRSSANNSSCFICGGTGHWVRECPENQDKGLDVRSGRCFKCGNVGHLAKYCRGGGGGGGGGYRDRSPPPRYGRSRSRSPGGAPPRRRSPSPRGYRGGEPRSGSRRDYSPPRGGGGYRDGGRSPPRRFDDGPRGRDGPRDGPRDGYDSRRPASPRRY
ncbi:uncharacterized protein EV422DRAFT_538260 [Fimicolochytrium jonesii]|uniref:uncharacterized protein n=1 Tax=Fimicolochytrium jonesii TaxID=1396493 RepID=UPI0022FE4823|nr:uncharacterized protein EV422DRAFT_538260 [Fimicolochytrium jonesii]KAI8818352.1 hypothetical protein EV422DRAFT_538260 [Fimicolochytrium jonesii]